jgi:hypothetical protein
MRLWEEQLAVISSVYHYTRSCLPWATPQSTISGKSCIHWQNLSQEKTTFENIISLANQISKWLLPHSQLFQAKAAVAKFQPRKDKNLIHVFMQM